MVDFRVWLGEDFVASVRATDAHQQVILGRYVSDNVSLTLASVLASD